MQAEMLRDGFGLALIRLLCDKHYAQFVYSDTYYGIRKYPLVLLLKITFLYTLGFNTHRTSFIANRVDKEYYPSELQVDLNLG